MWQIWFLNQCFLQNQFMTNFEVVIAKKWFPSFSTFFFFKFLPITVYHDSVESTQGISYIRRFDNKSKLFFVNENFVEILMWWQYHIGRRANYTVLHDWLYSITWDPKKWLRIRYRTPNSQSKIWPPNATNGINNDSAPKIVFLMSLPDGSRFQT